MDIYEELAMLHLTRTKNVFLIPQYDIDNGWSCPDFLAIDLLKKRVMIVEVSSAASPDALINRIKNKDKQWMIKLKEELSRFCNTIDFSSWDYIIRVYIREICEHKFKNFKANDFEIRTFEKIGFSWNPSYYDENLNEGQNIRKANTQ